MISRERSLPRMEMGPEVRAEHQRRRPPSQVPSTAVASRRATSGAPRVGGIWSVVVAREASGVKGSLKSGAVQPPGQAGTGTTPALHPGVLGGLVHGYLGGGAESGIGGGTSGIGTTASGPAGAGGGDGGLPPPRRMSGSGWSLPWDAWRTLP